VFNAPFDVTFAPTALYSDDAPSQDEVLQVIQKLQSTEVERGNYYDQIPVTTNLSRLEARFNRKNRSDALASLTKRVQVNVDAEYTIESDDNTLSWNADTHFLDFLTTVSSGIGLDAAVPNEASLHWYEFKLRLDQPQRQFSAKYARLGFDPVGSMLWIGYSMASENVWIAMAPSSALEVDAIYVPAGTSTGRTSLAVLHYRVLCIYCAYVLSVISYPGLWVKKIYPNPDKYENIDAASNFRLVEFCL